MRFPFLDFLWTPAKRPATRRTRGADGRRQPARKLLLEGLEDRRVMAFNVLAEYSASVHYPQDLLLTQIDAGSQPDMVVVNGDGTISIRLGNADGTFGSPLTVAAGSGARAVVAGDFNGDGKTDLVTANINDLSLLLGNGDGSFQPPVSISIPGQPIQARPQAGIVPQYLSSLAAGDLNADGKLDLVVTGRTEDWYCPYGCYVYGDGYANVLLGNGSGGFSLPAVHPLSQWPGAVAIEDLNHDGNRDVIVAIAGGLSVLPGNGTGALGTAINSGSGGGLSSISLGDIDGDGNLDTVLRGGAGLQVQKGQGDGTFVPAASIAVDHSVDSAVMGDVNGDGKIDLVAVGSRFHCTSGYWYCYDGYSNKLVTVSLGNGQGSFSAPITSLLGTADYYSWSWLRDAALADLTGDGRPELVTIDSYQSTAIVAANDGNWVAPPSISISDATVVEGNSGTVNAVFTVSVVGEHNGVSVSYATANGTAAAGADYAATSGTLTFGAGETSKTISVPVLGDTLDEHDEQFFVNLFSPVGGVIVDSQGVGTIVDDDDPPLITINDVSKAEGGNKQTTSFVFTVSLSEPSGKWVSVNFATADGTATVADADYFANSGTVWIAPGQTTATITVTVRGDKQKEADETFFVNLSGASGATISDDQGKGTILNDDGGKGNGKGNSGKLAAALDAEATLTKSKKKK